MSHNITDGKWVYGQVYYNNYLQSIGVENPMKSLLKDDMYYVASKERCEMIEIFLQEHYDKTIEVKQISMVDDIPVWKFYKEARDK